MKKCEICTSPASMYCESDEASLCWDCDEKVHSANFLVAKNSRFLLCHLCQSPTPWQAVGPKLSPTVSVCLSCAEKPEIGEGESQDEYEDNDNMDDDQGCSESDDDEEEDAYNQVVPLSSSPSPSPVASSSGSNWQFLFPDSTGIERRRRLPNLQHRRTTKLIPSHNQCCKEGSYGELT
ncbi:hypothetical protein LguiB_002981 [Lonicera macranthoides]